MGFTQLKAEAKQFTKRPKAPADPLFLALQSQASAFIDRPVQKTDDEYMQLSKSASRFAQRRVTAKSVGFFSFDIRTHNKHTFSEEEVVYCWARDFLGRRDAERKINSGLAKAYRNRVIAEMLNEIDAWIPVSWYRS